MNLNSCIFIRKINILKTRCLSRDAAGNASVEVTAYGFKGVNRVEIVPVYGDDGKWHDVPVEWVEYLPVERKRTMHLKDLPGEGDAPFCNSDAVRRRSIYSVLD